MGIEDGMQLQICDRNEGRKEKDRGKQNKELI